MRCNSQLFPAILPGLLFCWLSIGCTGETKPFENLVPVRGVVTLDGKPLPSGSVLFYPVDQVAGQSAVGNIVNGKFNAITTVSSPGVIVGKYQLCILAPDESKGTAPLDSNDIPPAPPSLVPEKYTSIATSGLDVDVSQGMAPLKLELKSP